MLYAAYEGEQKSELCAKEVSLTRAGRDTKIEI